MDSYLFLRVMDEPSMPLGLMQRHRQKLFVSFDPLKTVGSTSNMNNETCAWRAVRLLVKWRHVKVYDTGLKKYLGLK